jgi:hypothetical protein
MTDQYRELQGLRDAVSTPVLLDGETVVLDSNGMPDFAALWFRNWGSVSDIDRLPFTCGSTSEYAHPMRRIGAFCLLILAVAAPACGEHSGHQGSRADHAVSAAMKLKTRETIYRHTLSEKYAGYQANGQHGYARVRVVVRVTNNSDHNLIVRECSGRAENARGQQLFSVEPFSGDYSTRVLAPGTGFGGPMGYSPRITPVVRGAAAIRSVDRFETSCLAYQWEGPVPPPPGDS